MESNHPTGGLLRPAGFEGRMGHQAPAAPGPIVKRGGGRRSGASRAAAAGVPGELFAEPQPLHRAPQLGAPRGQLGLERVAGMDLERLAVERTEPALERPRDVLTPRTALAGRSPAGRSFSARSYGAGISSGSTRPWRALRISHGRPLASP